MKIKNCRLLFWLLALIIIILNSGALIAQNIVSNPSFEIGNAGELPDEWQDQKEGGADGNVMITGEEAHSGKLSLLIENTNDEGYIHPNKSIEIQPGDYAFSFWAKSDEDIRFQAQLYSETDWNLLFDVSCSLKNNAWTRFEFPVSFVESLTASIQIGLIYRGRLWLDDVELVKKSDARELADIKIWDTVSPIQDLKEIDTDWKLLSNEISEPQGDAVLENDYFNVAFYSKMGKVAVYSKSGQKRIELAPIQLMEDAKITNCKILMNTGDKATIDVVFSANEIYLPVTFSFNRKQSIEIKSDTNGIRVSSPMEYAIVPNFISDDLIFDPKDYEDKIYVPSENLFLGLLSGRDGMLFITLPLEKQNMKLVVDKSRIFDSIEIESGNINLALMESPGIWHEEQLKPTYLESDIAINWERPFPAKWVTQLYEDGVKTTYTFKESEPDNDGFWRAAVGWYTYPVWFDEGKGYFHLGKKIPPKGESIIYFLERMGTPVSISTPVDIIKETLDTQVRDRILDAEGRRNRSLTRPNCAVGTATCEVTDAIKRVFESGEEMEKRDYIEGGTEDMIYFLKQENERAMEYQSFAAQMIEFLSRTRENKPEYKPFLDKIEGIARELIAAYEYEKENLKDMDYARKIAVETVSLTQHKSPDNLDSFRKLKEEWTGMGGSVDDLNRILHTITRKLFQEAGYYSVDQPEKVRIAEDIRKMAIDCLRRPGGYEIWSEY